MSQKNSLLWIILYGFLGTFAILYGLVIQKDIVVTFIVFHLIVCLGIPVLHGWREGRLRKHWRDAWLGGKLNRANLLLSLGSGLFLLAAIVLGVWLLFRRSADPQWVRTVLVTWGIRQQTLWLFGAYLIIVNSLLEELLWRGFIQQRLLLHLPDWQAIGLSSFFYALYHLIIGVVLFGWKWGMLITVLVYVVGAGWGWMKRRHPTLYVTWFSHLLADTGIVLCLYWWIF
ncbi:CPBP family intramembrane glutamic endopeptidase [Brevibacillus fulvus]|uniref:Membrane protease YdiL (CAAX protease family) n=1 Tax=Brevibacillus fulvus TaxID=1125967 RepID=A0A939BTE2_9BACL|nr:type II CAAX endopeptidase family protein [Brevibacillus fulvus]MBM7589384.1 membrane protease YdiL (CAAX protease family) [Brevibacillus fulvus]